MDLHLRTTANFKTFLRDQKIHDGGGGGGGATYVFTVNFRYAFQTIISFREICLFFNKLQFQLEKGHQPEPLVVAAGGGGLAHGPFVDNGRQHGNGINTSLPNITAPSIGQYPAGK